MPGGFAQTLVSGMTETISATAVMIQNTTADGGQNATAPAGMEAVVWPQLSNANLGAIISINLGSLIFAFILLRCIWKPPTKEELERDKQMHRKIEEVQESYGAIQSSEGLEAGEIAGDYSAPWHTTFDMFLLIFMVIILAVLLVWTHFTAPALWTDKMFWIMQLPKVGIMMAVALLGGLTCRHFCPVDESGYITTSKHSIFKVNYTRKFQHFAAYMVPLVIKYKSDHVEGPIVDAWGDWFTLLAFLLLIKPIRESLTFFMLQFNSLDRPEDRPHTLKWIIAGNILPGLVMIIFWRWALSATGQEDLAFIFVFITGIGDGLAEPVGIWAGRHKYWTSSLFGDRKYQRSYEGSCCLFIGSLVFTSMFWYAFENQIQFWVVMAVLPPLMTYAEAVSPHTMDTPFLMGLGGLVVWMVSSIKIEYTA